MHNLHERAGRSDLLGLQKGGMVVLSWFMSPHLAHQRTPSARARTHANPNPPFAPTRRANLAQLHTRKHMQQLPTRNPLQCTDSGDNRYCGECLDKMLDTYSQCPVCRTKKQYTRHNKKKAVGPPPKPRSKQDVEAGKAAAKASKSAAMVNDGVIGQMYREQ